jgi:hypothetical protein
MAGDTMQKVEAATLTIRVPKHTREQFSDAARIISEIIPKKPVNLEDLISFMLIKESTGTIVIDFLEFVQNCDESVLTGNGADRPQPVSHSRTNGH